MSVDYQVNRRTCATCQYWGGARQYVFRGTSPFYVRVAGSAAPCMGKASMSSPATCCSKWKKWVGL